MRVFATFGGAGGLGLKGRWLVGCWTQRWNGGLAGVEMSGLPLHSGRKEGRGGVVARGRLSLYSFQNCGNPCTLGGIG